MGSADAPRTAREAELEQEVARLKAELAQTTEALALERELYIQRVEQSLPKTEEEFLRVAREGQTLRKVLDELGFSRASKASP